MVTGAMEMLLGSDRGNCAFAIWQNQGDLSILLEAIFVLECVAPANLHADRFLPASPVRVVVNHLQDEASLDFPPDLLVDNLEDCSPDLFLDNPPLIKDLFPQMMEKAHELAEENAHAIIAEGLKSMQESLGSEISRLQDLARVNPNIREEEIDLAVQERDTLQQNISATRLRLDALRLIWKGPLP
jgi:ATP-dependent helicase HepA